MIAAMPKAPAGRPEKNRVFEKPDSFLSLDKQGIDKNLAHRARKAATEFTVGPDSGDGRRQVGARKNKRQARRSSDGASSNSCAGPMLDR
jgi:hypothetical protein